jgi:hypothetical protein
MKYITFVAALLLVSVIPLLAGGREVAYADNTTNIDFGISENVSFGVIKVSIADNVTNAMETAMLSVLKQKQSHDDSVMASIVGFLVCILVSAWAVWKTNYFISMMASVIDIMFGLTFASTQTVKSVNWVVGVIVAVIGTYFLLRIPVNAWRNRRKDIV